MGVLISTISELLPPKSKFFINDIPDLEGKVMVVTGANTGIGKETAKALLSQNAKVYIAARSHERAKIAIDDLKLETGREAIFLQLDLSDLRSVKAAAEEFLSKEKALHVLFNNAGVMAPPIDQITAQGYDMQFGTNVLGHFFFTKLLMPGLLAGSKSSSDGKARVINTSSSGSYMVNNLNFNTIKDSSARRKYGGWLLYFQSKLGNILFSNELARRYGDQDIVSISLNPGNFHSDLQRHRSLIHKFLIKLILYPTSYGALTQLYAGTSAQAINLNGKYLVPWARVGRPNPVSDDSKLAQELWVWMEEQIQDYLQCPSPP